MSIEEVLEDVKRHLDYVEATKQMSIRDNQIKKMYEEIERLQDMDKILRNENINLKLRINKAIEYIKKDTRWFDSEYAKTYGELCTCKGANSNRLEVMVNPSNLLKILDKEE